MSRLKPIILGLLSLLACLQSARAWDEVSHGHVTALAIERVETAELKQFLLAHRDEVLSGSWYPDWVYQIKVKHRYREHNVYLDALWRDVRDPSIQRRKDYGAYLAHYFGVYAHVVEDRTLDGNVGALRDEVGDAGRDDMEMGMVAIATYGYLKRDFTMSLPVAAMKQLYRKAGFLDNGALTDAQFETKLREGLEKQNIESRSLKFLSFLAAGWAQARFPFAATKLETAPGGFADNAAAVAACWEALWAELHGKAAPRFVYAIPQQNGVLGSLDAKSVLGRIFVVTAPRTDITRLRPENIVLRGEKSGIVPARIVSAPDRDNVRDVAFVVGAERPWVARERYRLTIEYREDAGGTDRYELDFRAPAQSFRFARPDTRPIAFAFGLWGAGMLYGLGGLLFGLPGIVRLGIGLLRRRLPERLGYGFHAAALPFKAVGVALWLVATWFLVTDGSWLIEYLRLHH